MTKKIVCPAPGCQEHRRHHQDPDNSRGPQYIEVADDWTPDRGAMWCSLTCAMMAGAMNAANPQPIFWKTFLEMHQALGAHFHGEGDPPDLVLEVRLSEESESRFVVSRPPGHPDTDLVRNGMCWEMYHLMRKAGGEKKTLWFVNGVYLCQGSFSYTLRKDSAGRVDPYYGSEPKWYQYGLFIDDDHGYTLGVDIWETQKEAAQIAKENVITELEIQEEELNKLRANLAELDSILEESSDGGSQRT